MIVAVKNNNKKRFYIKLASLVVVVLMFVIYYNYMSDEFSSSQNAQNLNAAKVSAQEEKKNKIERLVYREIETAVDLIGQRNVQLIKMISDKVIIVADVDTNLDALRVRYGTLALIKKDIKNIKIAIDIQRVIESSLNE